MNTVIVPFYNEKETLRSLCSEIEKYTDLIICVNDGSDDSGELEIENLPKVILVSHTENLGKGMAINTGIMRAIRLKADKVIIIDADFQHDIKYIPAIFEMLDKTDFVLTNRRQRLRMIWPHRILSNWLTSLILSKKLGVKISDSQCGFRGYTGKTLKTIVPDEPGFEAETEMLIRAVKGGFNFATLDIPVLNRKSGKSKMQNWKTVKGFLNVIKKY